MSRSYPDISVFCSSSINNITTNIETAVLSSVDLLHSPTITITVDILMNNRKTSSRITIVMITVDLSRVKTPFLLPATLRGSCLVMKSAKFQIISPKSYPFQTTLLINHTVCRRWPFWATPSQCQAPKGKNYYLWTIPQPELCQTLWSFPSSAQLGILLWRPAVNM